MSMNVEVCVGKKLYVSIITEVDKQFNEKTLEVYELNWEEYKKVLEILRKKYKEHLHKGIIFDDNGVPIMELFCFKFYNVDVNIVNEIRKYGKLVPKPRGDK